MLDLRTVVDHLDEVRVSLARRGAAFDAPLATLADLATRRRALIASLEALRAKQNEANAAMAKLDKKGDEFASRRGELRALGDESKRLAEEQKATERELEELLAGLPNLPHASTPDGKTSDDNPVVRSWGEKRALAFQPKDHVDLGTSLGLLDFDRATKVSGTRFALMRGAGARLERALLSFMVDLHVGEHGYTEMWPPSIVKESALFGTGQLPKFAEDLFRLAPYAASDTQGQDQYLIPTAEVPLTNLHGGEILSAADLPVAYTAYTPCFRSEAGSYGKDTRGLIRLHQFDKVELVRLCAQEQGEAELERLTSHAEAVLQKLGLHYRVVQLCTGDLGFSARKTYDLEVWLPGQNAYREISSCSWCGDFQARRANVRYRPAPEVKPQFVHTLNGSGLAIGRTWVAIVEQYQEADGSISIPSALVPYMGGLKRIATA